MARISGKLGQVKMDPAGGSSLTTVADVNGWTIDLSKSKVDVTCFGDTNIQRVVTLPDFQGTLQGIWNSTNIATLVDAILGSTAVTLRLVPNTDEPTYYFEGLAYLDGSIDATQSGAVTFSGSWVAAGNWTFQP